MTTALMLILIHTLTGPTASLGEVAWRESLRRASQATSVTTLNNASLGPVPERPARPAPPAAGATAVDPEAAPPGEADEPHDEAWWRARMTTARETLGRNRVLRDALQSRVSALASDIVGRDDPAQRAQLIEARQQAMAELDRLVKQIQDDEKAIVGIEEDARKAGVPPGWIR